VNLTATDSGTPALTDSASDTPSYLAQNDAPLAHDDSLVATEDTPVIYTAAQLLGNDVDEEGALLTIASVTSGTGGTAVLNGDGTVSFTPNNNFNGVADFTYTLTDGDLTSNTAAVTVNVAPVNDAPNIEDVSVSMNENADSGTSVTNVSDSFSGIDFDRDGDAITYSITGGNDDDIFEINSSTGEITIATGKTLDYESASVHNLTVTATDGTLSDTATITVNVNNLIVEAVDDVGSVEETATLSVVSASGVLANDIGSTSVSSVNGVAGNVGNAVLGVYGALTLNADGSYTYVATANSLSEGEVVDDVFTYVTSGVGGSDTATLTITLTGTNDLPIFGGVDTGAVEEDVNVAGDMLTATGTLSMADPDNGESMIDTSVAVISSGNLGALVITPAGTWTYTVDNAAVQYLAEGEVREEVFTVTSKDGSTHDITVTITGQQDNPVAQDVIIPVPKNASHVLTVDDFDVTDADSNNILTVTITSVPGQGVLKYYDGSIWVDVDANDTIPYIDIENGLLVYVPAENDTGNESFSYTVTEGTYTTAGNTVTFSINTELSVSSPLPIDEGRAAVFVVELSDSRAVSTELTLTLGGEAVLADDYSAALQYRIQNSDGSYTGWLDVVGTVLLAAGQTRLEVKVLTLSDEVENEIESLTLTASISNYAETDMANLSATGDTVISDLPSLLVSGPSYLSESATGTADADYVVGIFDLELSATKTTTTNVSIHFEGVAQLGVDFQYSIDGGINWISDPDAEITIPADDPDNGISATYEIWVRTLPDAVVEIDEVLRLVALTHDADVSNRNEEITASTLIVEPVSISTDEHTPFLLEPDEGYTYSLLGQGSHGNVTDNEDGTLTYEPNEHFSGTDSFTMTKKDSVGNLVTSIVTVNVAAVADAPTVSISPVGEPVNNDDAIPLVHAIDNGTFTGNISGWSVNLSNNANGSTFVQYSSTSGGRMSFSAQGSNRWAEARQTITELEVGEPYTIYMDLTTTTGFTFTWNTTTITPTLVSGTTYQFSVTGGAGDDVLAIRMTGAGANTTRTAFVDNVILDIPEFGGTYTYTVNIDADLVDTDGSETLKPVLVSVLDADGVGPQTMPSGAVLFYSNGDAVPVNIVGSSWLVDPARLSGLQLRVDKPVAASSFTLTAVASSEESSNLDTASSNAFSVVLTMPTDGSDTPNLIPQIGNSDITLSNEADFVGSVTQTISTQLGDGENTFSWLTLVDSLPNIYANGELVEFEFNDNGVGGILIGTTSEGTVFTLEIKLNEEGDADVTYHQLMSLGSEFIATGTTMETTGGNGDDLLLTFNTGETTFSAVITGENVLDGTSTTINTNNKYIGASNNLMNPSEQVTMNFAATGNAVSAMMISFFNFDSTSNSAPDELTIYYTTMSGATGSYYITNAVLDSSGMYTIVAPNGEQIETLIFEAGSQSSFKLGIESVTAVKYDVNFDLQLEYQLTDVDGDSARGTISLTLDGDNSIIGTTGDDVLLGGSSADVISGNAGNDDISGGAGNDTLSGDPGSDVFHWALTDAGAAGTPALDVITDFDEAFDTDKLDLRDLLEGENSGNLANFLHFEISGTDTIVHVSSDGGFSGGYNAANEVQTITLQGVNLVGSFTTDQDIIQNLVDNKKLITD
jgi:VCBS repeat-containing protein